MNIKNSMMMDSKLKQMKKEKLTSSMKKDKK